MFIVIYTYTISMHICTTVYTSVCQCTHVGVCMGVVQHSFSQKLLYRRTCSDLSRSFIRLNARVASVFNLSRNNDLDVNKRRLRSNKPIHDIAGYIAKQPSNLLRNLSPHVRGPFMWDSHQICVLCTCPHQHHVCMLYVRRGMLHDVVPPSRCGPRTPFSQRSLQVRRGARAG